MGINTMLQLLGAITFEQPWIMTGLFLIFYIILGKYALKYPVVAVVMYYGTVIMNPQMHFPLFTELPMAKIVVCFCVIACIMNSKKISFKFPPFLIIVILFIITANISAISAIQPELSEQRFEEFNKIMIITIITTIIVASRKDYTILFYGLLSSFFFDIMKNLIETQTMGSWGSVRGSFGWLSDSNDWALALSMALPLFYTAIIMNWQKGWKTRVIFITAAIGALLTLTLTSSRGGFLAAMISGLAFILMDRKPVRALITGAMISIVVWFYMPESFVDKVQTLIGMDEKATAAWSGDISEDEEYTGAERVYFWHIAYDVMLEHPTTGVGWGNFIKEMERRAGAKAVAHSTWFQVGAEAGVPGIVCYIIMTISALTMAFVVWVRSRRSQDIWLEIHSRTIFCGLLAFCVGASFVSRENSELLFLYITITSLLPRFILRKQSRKLSRHRNIPSKLIQQNVNNAYQPSR